MKKKYLLILPLLLTSATTSCSQDNLSNIKDNAPFISEIGVSSNVFESYIEVTNKNEIKDDVYLNFYKGKDILLSLNLKDYFSSISNTSFIFANPSYKSDLGCLNYSYLEKDVIYGFNYIEIKYKDYVLGSVGTLGYSNPYIENGTLIKNENSLKASETFNSFEWYKVVGNEFDGRFGVSTPIDYEEFLEGPKLDERYMNASFLENETPKGGVYETSVSKYVDGDTTYFTFKGFSNIESSEKVRYYLVNTPEIDHTSEGSSITEQPWGEAAKKYTYEKLKNAKHILIQSALGGSIRDTYKRILGFVWYTNEENPSYSDYNLLNYELVKEGYGKYMNATLDEMNYKNIPYTYYFNYANDLASSKGIKIWGEKDPNYNY